MSTTSTTLTKLVEQLSTLTVMEAAELAKLLEEKWGVQAAAPIAFAASAEAASAEAAPEKTEFDLRLESIGDKKIEVIKVVREITGLGLKEAKDLVESAPATVKAGINKAEAESMKEKLAAAGAKADIK